MNPTAPHRKWNPLSPFIVIPLFLLCLYVTLFAPCSSLTNYNPYMQGAVEETLIVPVNIERFTTNQYSEWVTITISGQGQIDSDTTHSSFYEYNTNGSVNRFNGFTIDGQPLIGRGRVFALSAPTPINPLIREYRFLYHVGDEARRIKFLIDNGNPEDNSSFIINVTSRNLVDSPGR